MNVTPGELLRIAALAKLELGSEQVESLARDLEQILGHVSTLQSVDTEGVQAVDGIGAGGAPLGPDHGPPAALARTPDAFAPEFRDGFFLVPRLASHQDRGVPG